MNFAFIALKTMRFYGWSWRELMSTPISAFWTCYRYIERLRADEALSSLDASCYPHATEEGRKEVYHALKERMGTVSVEIEHRDEEGWQSLKKLSQQ